MAQAQDSKKTAALPSQKKTDVGETEEQRIDHTADKMAERANNRTKSYENNAPDEQIFTK